MLKVAEAEEAVRGWRDILSFEEYRAEECYCGGKECYFGGRHYPYSGGDQGRGGRGDYVMETRHPRRTQPPTSLNRWQNRTPALKQIRKLGRSRKESAVRVARRNPRPTRTTTSIFKDFVLPLLPGKVRRGISSSS